eukprot:CAMPEP_0197861000 /NCGR_PEP_ID=MMETSP1438-20131217/36759_1 /TAXON_ID=1461541 /ORGANISM="Pterosperma sp., Strain CCMP1384" /LENGTH=205 /DNA_ID=CAMNT_0043478047 /DNA_START=677 /DNA_END=1291 /DNA_ORIENTATION=+
MSCWQPSGKAKKIEVKPCKPERTSYHNTASLRPPVPIACAPSGVNPEPTQVVKPTVTPSPHLQAPSSSSTTEAVPFTPATSTAPAPAPADSVPPSSNLAQYVVQQLVMTIVELQKKVAFLQGQLTAPGHPALPPTAVPGVNPPCPQTYALDAQRLNLLQIAALSANAQAFPAQSTPALQAQLQQAALMAFASGESAPPHVQVTAA